MSVFLVFGLASVILSGIFLNRARKRVVVIRDRSLEHALSSIRNVYIEISEDYDRGICDLAYARQLFHDRADAIIFQYCEQLYGSVENTPAAKYRRLREQVKALDDHFAIAFKMTA